MAAIAGAALLLAASLAWLRLPRSAPARRDTHRGTAPAEAPTTGPMAPASLATAQSPAELPPALIGKTTSDLQERLKADLDSGAVTLAEALELLRTSPDRRTAHDIAAAIWLSRHRRDPLVSHAFIEMLRHDPAEFRREIALLAFSGQRDDSGAVFDLLLSVAQVDSSEHLRILALEFLGGSIELNPSHADAVGEALLRMARTDGSERVRRAALLGLHLEVRPASMIEEVRRVLDSASGDTVMASIEALTGVGESDRPAAGSVIKEAYTRLDDRWDRHAAIWLLLRMGPETALATLRRLGESDAGLQRDIADFVAILESGESDLDRIAARKTAMEEERDQ